MKIMLVMTNYAKNYASPRGRLPWMKGAGLVVSLGGVNFGFWPHFYLVPRSHYSVPPKRFRVTWSKHCSPRIRHQSELTERDWEKAVQGLGKSDSGLG